MDDSSLAAGAVSRMGDPGALLNYTQAVMPTRFGRCIMSGTDWRKAAREVISVWEDHGGWPDRGDLWLQALDEVASRVYHDEEGDWLTPEAKARMHAPAEDEC